MSSLRDVQLAQFGDDTAKIGLISGTLFSKGGIWGRRWESLDSDVRERFDNCVIIDKGLRYLRQWNGHSSNVKGSYCISKAGIPLRAYLAWGS